MDYRRWSLATNLSTLIIATFGLLAAVTYYFSLFELELRYYILTYIFILVLILFVFFAVFLEKKEVYTMKKKGMINPVVFFIIVVALMAILLYLVFWAGR